MKYMCYTQLAARLRYARAKRAREEAIEVQIVIAWLHFIEEMPLVEGMNCLR